MKTTKPVSIDALGRPRVSDPRHFCRRPEESTRWTRDSRRVSDTRPRRRKKGKKTRAFIKVSLPRRPPSSAKAKHRQSQASPILSSQSGQNHGHITNQALNSPPSPDVQTKLPYKIDGVTREQAAMSATAVASGQPYPYKPGEGGLPQTKTSLAQRSKYQFEADSSDDEIENEINEHLAILGQQAGRLNALAWYRPGG